MNTINGEDTNIWEFFSSEGDGNSMYEQVYWNNSVTDDIGKWIDVEECSTIVKIHFDDIEQDMLKCLRIEATKVLENVRREVNVSNNASLRAQGLSGLLCMWFNNDLLRSLLGRINRNLPSTSSKVGSGELFSFIKTEIWLALYDTFPSVYFEPGAACLYPTAAHGMSKQRYFGILKSLQATACDPVSIQYGAVSVNPRWSAPGRTIDQEIVSLFASLREQGRRIAFVPNVTIICHDDHHEQQRNKKAVEATGVSFIDNPSKRCGGVCHCFNSVCTGIHLGGDYEKLGSNTADSTGRLLRSLRGRDVDSDIILGMSNAIDVDRGYSGGKFIEIINKNGLVITATQLRTKGIPFIDKKANFKPSTRQSVLESRGILRTWWKRMKLSQDSWKNRNVPDYLYLMACRNGMGSIFFMKTTDKDLVNSWSLIPFRSYHTNSSTTRHTNELYDTQWNALDRTLQQWTSVQCDRLWFIHRKYRVSSSICDAGFYGLAKNELICSARSDSNEPILHVTRLPQNIKLYLQYLGYKCSSTDCITGDELVLPTHIDYTNKDSVMSLSMAEMKQILRRQLKKVSGNKSILADRIMEDPPEKEDAMVDIVTRIMKSYHMKPVQKSGKSARAFKIGKDNEPQIISNLSSCLEYCSRNDPLCTIKVLDNKDYGLVGSQSNTINPAQVTSVDNILLCEDTSSNTKFFACVEAKTATNVDTSAKEFELRRRYNNDNIYISIDVDGSELSKILLAMHIPKRGHRVQVTHHNSTFRLKDAFYVYASGHGICEIIRIVHLRFTDDILKSHSDTIDFFQRTYFQWINESEDNIPNLHDYGNCIDRESLIEDIRIWKAVQENHVNLFGNEPPPPIKHFLPTLAARHNRNKIGTDTNSRYQKNVQAKHKKMTPTGTYYLRAISFTLLNVYLTYALVHGYMFLMNDELCKSFTSYRIYIQNNVGSYRKFLMKLVTNYNLHDIINIRSSFDNAEPRMIQSASEIDLSIYPKYKNNKKKIENTGRKNQSLIWFNTHS